MDGVNFGERGSAPVIQYLNSLMSVSVTLWQEQLLRWTSLMQGVLLGSSTPEQVADVVTGPWRDALVLAGFPSQWWMRYLGHVPTLLLIVDNTTQAYGPVSVVTPFSVSGLTLRQSPILRLEGAVAAGPSETLPPDCIRLNLSQGGNRLEVSLVALHGSATVTRTIAPGHYLFLVYAEEGPTTRRPLAVVHVLKLS